MNTFIENFLIVSGGSLLLIFFGIFLYIILFPHPVLTRMDRENKRNYKRMKESGLI